MNVGARPLTLTGRDRLLRVELRGGHINDPQESSVPRQPSGARVGVIWWPERLHGQLISTLGILDPSIEVKISKAHPKPSLGQGGSDALVLFRKETGLADLAIAYAASTGASVATVEEAVTGTASWRSGMLVTDVLETADELLEGHGFTPAKNWGIVHVDEGPVGVIHLLKNLLARVGLSPTLSGRTIVAPDFSEARAIQDGDELYLFGSLPPERLYEAIATPRAHLLVHTHSSPFDAVFGQAAMCAVCTPEASADPRPLPGEQGLVCMAGGGCFGSQQRTEVVMRIPASAVAAKHIIWLGCDLILHRDSITKSRRALFLQFLRNTKTVTLVAPVRHAGGGFGELLHACCALDEGLRAGELRAALQKYAHTVKGTTQASRVLLGDPELFVPGEFHRATAPAPMNGRPPLTIRPNGLRSRIVVASAAWKAQPEGYVHVDIEGGGWGYGVIAPGATSEEQEIQVLAFGADQRPAASVHLHYSTPAENTLALLRLWIARAEFWQSVLWNCRDQLQRFSPANQDLQRLHDSCLALLGEFENVARRGQMAVHQALPREASWNARVAPHLWTLRGALAHLQPMLMRAMLGFASAVDPNVHSQWLAHYRETAPRQCHPCDCGRTSEVITCTADAHGVARTLVRCSRCGVTSTFEEGGEPLSFEVNELDPSDGTVRGSLGVINSSGSSSLLIGVARRAMSRRAEIMDLVAQDFGPKPGHLTLVLRPSAWMGDVTYAVHVYELHELRWRTCVAWTKPRATVLPA